MASLKEKEVLGEWSIYPGHPVTIAYVITQKYPSLSSATKHGNNYPTALEDNDIPGAGGSVYCALGLLTRLKAGLLAESLWQHYNEIWGQMGYDDRKPAGEEQARRFWPKLLEAASKEWLT